MIEDDAVASVSEDGALRITIFGGADAGQAVGLQVTSSARCVASSRTGSTIMVGDEWGNVHALRLVRPGPPQSA